MPVNIDEDSQMPTFDSVKLIGTKKIPFILLLVVIIVVYIFLFTFLNNMSLDNDKNKIWILILEIILVVILIVVVVLNMDKIKTDFNFSTEIKNLFNEKTPEIDIVAQTKEEKKEDKKDDKKCKDDEEGEVFHIFNNKYTYNQAREACTAMDARLATYQEVENSYNKGGSWCSYGWSEDQLALFPTSKDVYNKLKTKPNHKNDCGRQVVNGGFIGNKNIRFGVNCFGKKPVMDDSEKYFMDHYTFSPAYTDASYAQFDASYSGLNLLIAPFNQSKWNE